MAGFADDLTFAGDKSRWTQELQLSKADLFWFLFTIGTPLLCLATACGAAREI